MLGRVVWYTVVNGPASVFLGVGAAGLYGAYQLGARRRKDEEQYEQYTKRVLKHYQREYLADLDAQLNVVMAALVERRRYALYIEQRAAEIASSLEGPKYAFTINELACLTALAQTNPAQATPALLERMRYEIYIEQRAAGIASYIEEPIYAFTINEIAHFVALVRTTH